MKKILLFLFLFVNLIAKAQEDAKAPEDSLAPKFLYSVSYLYLNTGRNFNTHVHDRYSPLDYNTDVEKRGNGMGIGVNIYYIFNQRLKLEFGLLYTTNDYSSVQKGLDVLDTVTMQTEKKNDNRKYHMDRMSVPIKIHYNLQKKNFSWFFSGGIFGNRLYSEGIEALRAYGEFGRGGKVQVSDYDNNSLTYHRYQLDVTAGFGKLIRISSGLGMKVEAGYTHSALSVLKGPDKGWLSAVYMQLGFITW